MGMTHDLYLGELGVSQKFDRQCHGSTCEFGASLAVRRLSAYMTNPIRVAVPCAEPNPSAEYGKRSLVLSDCERRLIAPTIMSEKNMGMIKPEGYTSDNKSGVPENCNVAECADQVPVRHGSQPKDVNIFLFSKKVSHAPERRKKHRVK